MTAPRDPFSTPDPDRPAGADSSGQPWGQPGTGSSPTQPPEYGSGQPGEQTYGQPEYGAPSYGSPQPGQSGQPEPGQWHPGQSEPGQQPYGQAPYGQQPYGSGHGSRNGFGIAALVLGILALLTGLFVIGGLLGIAAIVLGVLGRGRAKRGQATNGGMALAGIILGVLGLLLSVLVVVGAASLFNSEQFSNLTECLQEAGSDTAAQQDCQRQFEEGVLDGS